MYFSGDLDVNTLRMRALRLVDMFSKCGAPGFFRTPDEYAREIARFDDIDSLNVWLGELARGFVCYAFNFTPAVNADALFKARRYVREHLSEKISLDEVAAHVHLSRSYVSSMFHQQTGEGLFEYIQRLRLERARGALLRGSDAPLCDIAAACGFEDQSYFTRAFRKAHGVTPGAFRARRAESCRQRLLNGIDLSALQNSTNPAVRSALVFVHRFKSFRLFT